MALFQDASFQIIEADSTFWLEATRELFIQYQKSLSIDLSFENFQDEIDHLPADYCSPNGYLVLAVKGKQAIGCCALRPIHDVDHSNACEMKRLYVVPEARGLGVGRLLAQEVLERAKLLGYSCVLLDTLDEMEAARALYEELGFEEISPFRHTPLAGAHYLKVEL